VNYSHAQPRPRITGRTQARRRRRRFGPMRGSLLYLFAAQVAATLTAAGLLLGDGALTVLVAVLLAVPVLVGLYSCWHIIDILRREP
jgi:hypothetical protein